MSMFRSLVVLFGVMVVFALGTGCRSDRSDDTTSGETASVEGDDTSGSSSDAVSQEQAQNSPGLDAVGMNADELESWEIRLVEYRIDKNESFKDPEKTPLRAKDLKGFEGLNYYYPAQNLRFHVPFKAEAKPDTIDLVKRKGNVVQNLRKGTVSFRYDGNIYSLAVFGPVDTTKDGDYLWLPFFDATSGKETYAGGRYLDLELDDQGTVELDFNFAYNPLCDYNHEKYNCTLPPQENRLPFPVAAGEKLFHVAE